MQHSMYSKWINWIISSLMVLGSGLLWMRNQKTCRKCYLNHQLENVITLLPFFVLMIGWAVKQFSVRLAYEIFSDNGVFLNAFKRRKRRTLKASKMLEKISDVVISLNLIPEPSHGAAPRGIELCSHIKVVQFNLKFHKCSLCILWIVIDSFFPQNSVMTPNAIENSRKFVKENNVAKFVHVFLFLFYAIKHETLNHTWVEWSRPFHFQLMTVSNHKMYKINLDLVSQHCFVIVLVFFFCFSELFVNNMEIKRAVSG